MAVRVPRVQVKLGSRALLVETKANTRAYVWDLFLPLCLFLTLLGAGLLGYIKAPMALVGVLPLLATKCAHVRVGRGMVVITWWWGPVPYRRRRFAADGHFIDDGGDDWSEEPATTFAYVPRGGSQPAEDDGWVWCRRPQTVTSFLNARTGVRVPEARTVREDR